MGCQMNTYDSDFLAQCLIQAGFVPVNDPETADIILVNTCTVRAKAEQKAFSLLGRLCMLKKRKPHLILGVVGCLAQQEGERLMERFPLVDLVMGPRALGRFQQILESVGQNGEKVIATELGDAPPQGLSCPGYFHGRVTGFVSIMEGCNNFCSYCIVPSVRGREVSRHPEEIIKETKALIDQGVKEITLLGQNVNSYRWQGKEGWDFVGLLSSLNRLNGIVRIRFTTSHPKDLSDRLIGCFSSLEHLCAHIHLPFQSGSNPILKRMKRGYTREHYLELIEKLRATRPDIAITSDVMVGFPGESTEDFEQTLNLVEKVQFDNLFSFKYSDRKGTVAEKLPHKVPEAEKACRLHLLQDLQKKATLKKNRSLEGKTVDVLVEGCSKKGEQLTGRTETNKIVNFAGRKTMIGQLVRVLIQRGFQNSLRGKPAMIEKMDDLSLTRPENPQRLNAHGY